MLPFDVLTLSVTLGIVRVSKVLRKPWKRSATGIARFCGMPKRISEFKEQIIPVIIVLQLLDYSEYFPNNLSNRDIVERDVMDAEKVLIIEEGEAPNIYLS